MLLYQPLRQSPGLIDPGLSRDEISRLLKPLLRVLRDVARVSVLVALLVSPLMTDVPVFMKEIWAEFTVP